MTSLTSYNHSYVCTYTITYVTCNHICHSSVYKQLTFSKQTQLKQSRSNEHVIIQLNYVYRLKIGIHYTIWVYLQNGTFAVKKICYFVESGFQSETSLRKSQSMPVFRSATVRVADHITRTAVRQGGSRPSIGPYDFRTFLEFDPKSYHIGEVDGKHVGQVSAIEFPKHHHHSGSLIVAEEFRNKGYGTACLQKMQSAVDPQYTAGGDIYHRS